MARDPAFSAPLPGSSEPAGETPVLAILNSRSGGGQGNHLIHRLRATLGEDQVFDLARAAEGWSPTEALQPYSNVPNLRVLVCGGDGTMGWVLSCIDKVDRPHMSMPIAMIPLGTGNDLSRTFGWGPGYSGRMSRPEWLQRIARARPARFDRWAMTIRPRAAATAEALDALPKTFTVSRAAAGSSYATSSDEVDLDASGSSSRALDLHDSGAQRSADASGSEYRGVFCNYFSIGVDSKIALAFHNKREAEPEKFTSQFRNHLWYAWFGFREGGACCSQAAPPVASIAKVFVQRPGDSDFSRLELPPSMRGIVFSNLRSYSGGRDLWGPGEYTAGTQRCKAAETDDALIEVVGIRNVYHMTALVSMNCCVKGQRLAQCSAVRIELEAGGYLQMDGEPWTQEPATLEISHHGVSSVLRAQ